MTRDDNAMWPGVVKGMWKLIGLAAGACVLTVAVVLVLR